MKKVVKKDTKQRAFIIISVVLLLAVVAMFFLGNKSESSVNDLVAPGSSSEVVSYMDLSAVEAKALIDSTPDLIIIDVSPNYAEGHLPGAVNYYVGDGSLDEAIPMLDKDAKYLVYCHIDSASRLGAQKLVDAGFTMVYRLEDHYSGWVAAGYPVEK